MLILFQAKNELPSLFNDDEIKSSPLGSFDWDEGQLLSLREEYDRLRAREEDAALVTRILNGFTLALIYVSLPTSSY